MSRTAHGERTHGIHTGWATGGDEPRKRERVEWGGEGFVFTPATTRSRLPRCRPCPPVPLLALTLDRSWRTMDVDEAEDAGSLTADGGHQTERRGSRTFPRPSASPLHRLSRKAFSHALG